MTELLNAAPPSGALAVQRAASGSHCRRADYAEKRQRFGLGMRKKHFADFVSGSVPVDFVEVISENFMVPGGAPLSTLRQVRQHYPVALHGVSLSVGSVQRVDDDHLDRLARLVRDIEPFLVSDHLCWTRMPGFSSHDLLPLPFTEEALEVVVGNVLIAQDFLKRQILLENPSTYLQFAEAQMEEGEFLAELCARTGCGLLLDVNNVFVTAHNLGRDAAQTIARFPAQHVQQVHLAGHTRRDDLLIDTHDQAVDDRVWALFEAAAMRLGPVAVMIERDDNIPDIDELLTELDRARTTTRAAVSA